MGCISSRPTRSAPGAKQASAAPDAPVASSATEARNGSPSSDTPHNTVGVAVASKAADTAVLRKANLFDQLDADAHKEPSLRDVQVHIGEHNKKLLDGFEEKHRLAHAAPVLQDVQQTDLRASKLFETLREYELKDERVRNEPKLQTTFTQREKQRQKDKHKSV